MSSINDFPDEIVLTIMEGMSLKDVLEMTMSCKRFYNLRKYISKTSEEVVKVKSVDELFKMNNAMPSLNYGLYLTYTEVSDISPLKDPLGLVNLKFLNLDHTRISDVSSLSNLVYLTYLNLWGTHVSDVSHLSKLVKLEKLDLGECHGLSDFSPLSNLKNLEELDLCFT